MGTILIRAALAGAVPLLVAASPPGGFGAQPLYAEATLGSHGPPSAPDVAPGLFTPAPVPDIDHQAPAGLPPEAGEAKVGPKLYHRPGTYHGEGYVFGSTVDQRDDSRTPPAPGIDLTMPLQ